jgi:hypothetical protein
MRGILGEFSCLKIISSLLYDILKNRELILLLTLSVLPLEWLPAS